MYLIVLHIFDYVKPNSRHGATITTMLFENEDNAHATKLATHVWDLKNQNMKHDAKCSLCLNEKYDIAMTDGKQLINKKTELLSKCLHVGKFMLQTFKA